jgi:D-inositol-3-phosphate glycosyltransferase
MQPPPRPDRPASAPEALAIVSVHASPLGRLGSGENGGMNLAIRRLCEELAARGIPSDVFVRRDHPETPAEQLIAPGSRLVHLDAGPLRPLAKDEVLSHLPAFTSRLLAHAESEERSYRLLHSHYWLSGWVASRAAALWRIPWVHSSHTLARLKAQAGLPLDPARAEMEQIIVRGADRLVAVSSAEERALHELYGASRDRVCVVPPGVDVELFEPRALTPLRVRYGVQGRRVILTAGRLERLKGVGLLIEALALLRREPGFDDVALFCAGDDSGDGRSQAGHPEGERGRLEALARSLHVDTAVSFLGAVEPEELAGLYLLADVVAVPSMTETFGLVALEAQAAGTPVVACAVGGLADTVSDGVTGVLVEGRDPADFAAALRAVLADGRLRRRMGDAARENAARHTWLRSADRLQSLYDCVESPEADGVLEACGCL